MVYKTKKQKCRKGGGVFTNFFNKGTEKITRTKNSLTSKFNTLKTVSKMGKEDRKKYFAAKKNFDRGINFDENCKNLDKCETDISSFLKSFNDDKCPLFYKKIKNLFDCYNSDPNNADDQIDMIVKNEDEFNEGTYLPDNLLELIQKAVDWATEKELRKTNYGNNDYDPSYIPEEYKNQDQQTGFDNLQKQTAFDAAKGGKRKNKKTKLKKTRKNKKTMKKRK